MAQHPRFRTFESCGTAYTDSQKAFVEAIEHYLKAKNCELFTVGKHIHSVRQPVEFARELIKTCDCAVVIAFERYKIVQGLEKPNSPEQTPIVNRAEPTVWNHLEAAMAYAHDLPLLVFVEKGTHRQAMLSKRFEWNAMEVELNPDIVKQEPFRQIVDDWLQRVELSATRRAKAKRELEDITIREYLASMTPKQLWGVIGVAFTVLSVVATAAFWLGGALAK